MTFAEAKEHLKDVISPDGCLYSLGWYLWWGRVSPKATLDGEFSADDLMAIATYMKETGQ